jgi:hypothetical protein
MSDPITIPPPEVLVGRIRLCREELAQLKRLLRLATSARRADEARAARLQTAPGQGGGGNAA